MRESGGVEGERGRREGVVFTILHMHAQLALFKDSITHLVTYLMIIEYCILLTNMLVKLTLYVGLFFCKEFTVLIMD